MQTSFPPSPPLSGAEDEHLGQKEALLCLCRLALAVLSCALWGSAIPAIRIGYALLGISSADVADQLVFAGPRFVLGGIIVYVLQGARTGSWHATPAELRAAAQIGFFQVFAQQLLGYVGLAHATGVSGSIASGAGVFMMLLASCFVFRLEKMTLNKALGCLCGFAGLLVATGGIGQSSRFGWGETLMLASSVAGAAATALMRKKAQSEDPLKLCGLQFMLGGACLLAAGLILGGRLEIATFPELAVLVWLAVVSAVGFSSWSLLLRDNDISRIAPYQFLIPVFGVALSLATIGSEGTLVGPATALALVLIAAGLILANRRASCAS